MERAQIERINFLAKKKKETGLTPEELQEQKELYKIYISAFRANFDQQLGSIDVTTPDGTVTPLKEFYKTQE